MENIIRMSSKKKTKISGDDQLVLSALDSLRRDLDTAYSSFDSTTNPALIDSYIFEIKALNMKYQYYIELCKQKGLASNVFA